MAEPEVVPDRRARFRAETVAEAKRIALEQLAESGAAGISVNAIAKRMGITGPALYRYFAGRDDLLTALIGDAYDEVAEALETAVVAAARKRSPQQRFRHVAHAFRAWALAQPHRYQLLFGTPVPGYHAPERTRAAAHRTMVALWQAVDDLPVRPAAQLPALDRQIAGWAERMWAEPTWPQVPTGSLRLALLAWMRLHGVLSTELAGHLAPMGVDPELLYTAEVEQFLAGG